jgi:hypothetical protein
MEIWYSDIDSHLDDFRKKMVTGFLNANQATSKGERALYQARKDLNWRESGCNTTAFGEACFPRLRSPL